MSTDSVVRFYQHLGYRAEADGDALWYRVPEGFMVRVPHHVVQPPTPEAAAGLLRRHRVLGLRYSLPAGEHGQPGAIYCVRDPAYDLPQLASRMRTRIRRGLRQCSVRVISSDELLALGLPLNEDTLQRQQRSDPFFTVPHLWARFCEAVGQCEAMHVWGAFAGDKLGAYSIVLRMGAVAIQLYQMSRTSLLNQEVNPALNFTQTYHLARLPGISAVSFGHVGLDSTPGLDTYKQALGYAKEPVTFVVKLRPQVQSLLLNPAARGAVALLRRALPDSHKVQRVEAVLAIAAGSAGAREAAPRAAPRQREADHAR